MPFDKLKYPEELWEERRKGVAESLRPISIKELVVTLKQHEEEFVGDPWRDEFVRLIQEQPHASFYLAIPQKDIVVYYCRDATSVCEYCPAVAPVPWTKLANAS